MRILFLEFDGVLHPASAACRLTPGGMLKTDAQRAWLFRWAWILDEMLERHPDVGIVVHSHWKGLAAETQLQSLLGPLGRRYIGVTPRASRWEGIAAVAACNHLRNYRILDARPSAFPPRLPELIACDPEAGLREFRVLRQLQGWLRMPV
jgi:hypothetical protein